MNTQRIFDNAVARLRPLLAELILIARNKESEKRTNLVQQ
jgi:hypothetical protein